MSGSDVSFVINFYVNRDRTLFHPIDPREVVGAARNGANLDLSVPMPIPRALDRSPCVRYKPMWFRYDASLRAVPSVAHVGFKRGAAGRKIYRENRSCQEDPQWSRA